MSSLDIDAAAVNSMATAWSPTSASNQVVAIELICEIICKHLDRVGEPKRNLLNLALSNKFFLKETALKQMWTNMHSLTPHLALLPEGIITATQVQACIVCSVLGLDTPATAKFRQYAGYLHSLTFKHHFPSALFPLLSVYHYCSNHGPNTASIFPALTRVTFASPYILPPVAGQALLTPFSPITKLAFTGLREDMESTFASILAHFSEKLSRTLQELTLKLPSTYRPFDMQALRSIQAFTALKKLSIATRYAQFPIFSLMKWILGLQNLEVLKIDVPTDPSFEQADEFKRSMELGPISLVSRGLRSLRLCGSVGFFGCVLPLFPRDGVRDVITLQVNCGISPGEIRREVKEQLIDHYKGLFSAPVYVEV